MTMARPEMERTRGVMVKSPSFADEASGGPVILFGVVLGFNKNLLRSVGQLIEQGAQGFNQGGGEVAKFATVLSRKVFQLVFSRGGQQHADVAPIVSEPRTLDQSVLHQAVHQADGTVMADQEVVGEHA